MDPEACYARWKRAVETGDDDAADAHADLMTWIGAGGFPPAWTSREHAAFRTWKPAPPNDAECVACGAMHPSCGVLPLCVACTRKHAEKVGVR